MPETRLGPTTEAIIERFEATSAARDRALADGRQIIRLSANSIRATHRGEDGDAERLLADARRLLSEMINHVADYPSVYWAGYVQDAMKEYAEAAITRDFVNGNLDVPTPDELGVEDAPYLNALAEAASEVRRDALDALRLNQLDHAERLLACMDTVYDILVSIDFPDAITGGLRRRTDQLRGVLERTRGDLTITLSQQRLERALAETQRKMDID
ncbi:MAG TPA: haloacid dehalogenase [Thermomicrobiales bacterium]|nr:haloacid dehalogenase [Thermomicrobiales bacterium]